MAGQDAGKALPFLLPAALPPAPSRPAGRAAVARTHHLDRLGAAAPGRGQRPRGCPSPGPPGLVEPRAPHRGRASAADPAGPERRHPESQRTDLQRARGGHPPPFPAVREPGGGHSGRRRVLQRAAPVRAGQHRVGGTLPADAREPGLHRERLHRGADQRQAAGADDLLPGHRRGRQAARRAVRQRRSRLGRAVLRQGAPAGRHHVHDHRPAGSRARALPGERRLGGPHDLRDPVDAVARRGARRGDLGDPGAHRRNPDRRLHRAGAVRR